MSGLTTTGATVISGLDSVAPGLLLWRGLLQWIGGIGIIVMSIAVLPMLQIGGMQLFRMESSDTSEKILPRSNADCRLSGYSLCHSHRLRTGLLSLPAWMHSMPLSIP